MVAPNHKYPSIYDYPSLALAEKLAHEFEQMGELPLSHEAGSLFPGAESVERPKWLRRSWTGRDDRFAFCVLAALGFSFFGGDASCPSS